MGAFQSTGSGAVYFGEVDLSPHPMHTVHVKIALQCLDGDRFELKLTQLVFRDPENESLYFTEEHVFWRGKLIKPIARTPHEAEWFSLQPIEIDGRIWINGTVPQAKQVLAGPFTPMSGKGQGLIPTSKSVEIRLQHVTQLNPRMRLRQEAEVRNYKLLKIDPRTLDERMNFFTEIQALQLVGPSTPLSPGVGHQLSDGALSRSETVTDEIEQVSCRICLQGEEEEPLLDLQCNCKGSMAHLHESCLKKWIDTHDSSDDIDERKLPAVTCDVCKRIFDVRLVKRIIFSLYAEHKAKEEGVVLARKLMMLGKNLQYVGLLEEAARIMEEGLALYEGAHERDDGELADVLADVSVVYSKQTRYDEALEINRRALQIYEGRHGFDCQVANTLNNIAVIYWKQGEHRSALALYQRSLGIAERVLGPSHPHVADTLNNIAAVHTVQAIADDNVDMYKEALALYYRALQISESSYGSEHPDVAKTCYNIGILYRRLGHADKAVEYLSRDLAISTRTLGADHAQVRDTSEMIAMVRESVNANRRFSLDRLVESLET